MWKTTQQLEQAISEVMKPAGFTKKRHSWYLTGQDCISILDLQKSSWGNQFYINLAAAVKEWSETQFPRENQSDIRGRLTQLVAGKEQFEKCLNLEDLTIDSQTKRELVLSEIKSTAIPLLIKLTVLDGIRELVSNGALAKFMVSAKLQGRLS